MSPNNTFDQLHETTWRKSSRSASNPYCVEVGLAQEVVGIRDTKDRDGGTLLVDRDRWTSFLQHLKTADR